VNNLSREIIEILALPDVKERYARSGLNPGRSIAMPLPRS
jgi:hypothetical protein